MSAAAQLDALPSSLSICSRRADMKSRKGMTNVSHQRWSMPGRTLLVPQQQPPRGSAISKHD